MKNNLRKLVSFTRKLRTNKHQVGHLQLNRSVTGRRMLYNNLEYRPYNSSLFLKYKRVLTHFITLILCVLFSIQLFSSSAFAEQKSTHNSVNTEYKSWQERKKIQKEDQNQRSKKVKNSRKKDIAKETFSKDKKMGKLAAKESLSLVGGVINGALFGGALGVIPLLGGALLGVDATFLLVPLLCTPFLAGAGALAGLIVVTVLSDDFNPLHLFTRILTSLALVSTFGIIGGILGIFVVGPILGESVSQKGNPLMGLAYILGTGFIGATIGAVGGGLLAGSLSPLLEKKLE